MGAFKKYVCPEGGGRPKANKNEQGVGFHHCVRSLFKILYGQFCSRWLYLAHFYTLFPPSYKQLFAFCLVVSFFIYVFMFLSTFLEGGGCQNIKFSVRTEGGMCPKMNKSKQGGGGGEGGSKINAPM